MKLMQKMLISFLSVAFLVLVSGTIGLIATSNVERQSKIVIEEYFPIKDVAMEANIVILNTMDLSTEYQLSKNNLNKLKSRLEDLKQQFDLWVNMLLLGTESEEFKASNSYSLYDQYGDGIIIPVVKPRVAEQISQVDHLHENFLSKIESVVHNHDEMMKYNFDYADRSWEFGDFINLVELQHKDWIDQLSDSAVDNVRFTGQTDPTQCFFGKWFYNYKIDDPKLQKILNALEPLHDQLHRSAVDINQQKSATAKSSLYQIRVNPLKKKLGAKFDEITDYIDPLFQKFRDNSGIFMEQVNVATEQIEEGLHDLEALVDEEIEVAKTEAEQSRRRGSFFLILTIIISVAVAVFIGIIMSISITKPLKAVSKIADDISQGKLSGQKLNLKRKDEIGKLAQSFSTLVDEIKSKAQVLEQMAQNDFTVRVSMASSEDELGISLNTMKDSLNHALQEVNAAVNQVNAGSEQVSTASQSLSQGATEQASSIEEITSSLVEVSSQSKQNNSSAEEANKLAKQASSSAITCGTEMSGLATAMEQINESSQEITKVVNVIDDIAFQINLLALNANVEAARAGKYGKGFAVVAEEVRNLATRSANAVKETTTMVEQSNANIQNGVNAAATTSEELKKIIDLIQKIDQMLNEIVEASQSQVSSINQISGAIEQVSEVTQSNSASAEESASASEELAGQAQQLKSLISTFVLESSDLQ